MARVLAFIVLCPAALGAFAPASAPASRRAVASAASPLAPRMVAAQDVYEAYLQQETPVRQKIKDLGPAAAKGGSTALVAAAAAVGYVLMPSSRIAVNAVGAAATGALGLVGRKKIDEERREAASTAAAALLKRGLSAVTADEIASLAPAFGVDKPRYQKQLSELFLYYLSACLEGKQVLPAELSELLQLKELLGMSAAQVGNQVYAAGRALYSRHRAYLESDVESEPLAADAQAQAVLQAVPATAAQLGGMRDSLGVSEATAAQLHRDIFAKKASALLSPDLGSAAALTPEDRAALDGVTELLGLGQPEATEVVAELTAPLYAQSLSEALGALDAAGDAAGCAPLVSGLATRQQQLGMGADAAAEALRGAVRGSAAEKLGEACKALRVQDSAGAVSSLRSLLDYADRTTALVEAAGAASESGAPLYAGIGDGVLRDAEVLALYRLVLLQALQSKAVSAADAAALESLRLILGMSEVAAARVYEAAAGPIYRSAVEEAVAGELSAAAKQAVAAALADLALPASSAASIGLEVYSARLSGMVENGAILSEEQSEQLKGLRAFLGIEDEAVYAVHEQACAKAYRTSVKQVMGNAGAIPDEYWSGLDTLRERMVLSPDTAQALFVEEAQAKMCEFGTRALEALQEAQKEAQKGDSKGDKGIGGAVSSEVLNLVDFALAARVLTPQSADGVETEVAATSLKGKFEQRALNELYRQYLIEAFGGSDEAQNQRLLTSLGRLALVLGLESHEVNKVHNELGSIIIRRYAGNAIKAGPLGAKEMQFVDSIRATLELPQDRIDALLRDVRLNRVAALIEAMFEKSNLNSDEIRKVLSEADLLEVNLRDDLDVPKARLEKMFSIEMEALIEGDELTADDSSALLELCESLQIEEERAAALVDEAVSKRCTGGVLQATACMRRGASTEVVKELDRALKFARLSPSSVALPSVGENEKGELYLMYQARAEAAFQPAGSPLPPSPLAPQANSAAASSPTAQSVADLELLKTVIGISQPQVA
ncbi:hypothetical protein EMIHUDRAFT_459736 [Emiliania huxleyi CCMP1516]|uniref:Uncharacterized protein n=2 Tax=Emiliania huxleyi TaxID=2903 RepID=A0A0D3IKE2_EMIH1|nr:hypothetical protein EMIHUDRAFT_459736 [Emiliania huxleyi CCMP1516]EOD11727.1 hypothetical protein EMIHUDRAFT_459736 [Emiliania huxleyi CCMP1516]|eukprot:XP_005764156.1 hypothetical protein EMIHUDRAFT_459736 [Emiliania huxleyi CCMP1516]